MEENRRGQGIFLGVVGVATLVVAIIGATFAYFSASATNSTTVVGNTAEAANLELTITKKAADGNLIPLFDKDLGTAITGATGKSSCVDSNGNVVCHVYEIKLKNGKSPINITGSISFTNDATNLVYAVLEKDSESTLETSALATKAGATTVGTALSSPTDLHTGTGTAYAASAIKYYYVVIWLRDTSGDQNTSDSGKNYTGTVTFQAAGGTGVTATFSS